MKEAEHASAVVNASPSAGPPQTTRPAVFGTIAAALARALVSRCRDPVRVRTTCTLNP